MLISGHHFIPYSSELVEKMDGEILNALSAPELIPAHVGD
jgi:hypothetical protein